jgi:hypothetical protein
MQATVASSLGAGRRTRCGRARSRACIPACLRNARVPLGSCGVVRWTRCHAPQARALVVLPKKRLPGSIFAGVPLKGTQAGCRRRLCSAATRSATACPTTSGSGRGREPMRPCIVPDEVARDEIGFVWGPLPQMGFCSLQPNNLSFTTPLVDQNSQETADKLLGHAW